MPENRQNGNASTGASGAPGGDPVDKIEETMRGLEIQDTGDGASNRYPDRPGEADCSNHASNGVCDHGSNHHDDRTSSVGQGSPDKADLPERVGQPDCRYFLKTGMCKFGASCKYHHPQERRDGGQVTLNALGLPIRQDERPCQYYLRTQSCMYGAACKFDHPPPSHIGTRVPTPASSVYGATGSSLAPSSGSPFVGAPPSWSLSRPMYMSNARMQGPTAYFPIFVSSAHGIYPGQQWWPSYPSAMNHVPPTEASAQTSNIKPHLPVRPDQPECRYYMKTGNCKYGPSCKYNHTNGRNYMPDAFTIGPHQLPLRPGQIVCSFYATYGTCEHGLSCKYDHPVPVAGYYVVPTTSFGDSSAFHPYQSTSPSSFAWMPSDTAPVRTPKSADGFSEPDSQSINVGNTDTSVSDGPPQGSGSPSQTAPSSGSPREQFD